MPAPEAFVLLTLPNAVLTAFGTTETGTLSLVCVTVQVSDGGRDVYLMLRLGSTETPIDPAGKVERTDTPGMHTYTFYSTEVYPAERTVKLPTVAAGPSEAAPVLEDLETFESLLGQYGNFQAIHSWVANKEKEAARTPQSLSGCDDLRGHLVAINEDTGEVIGQFGDSQIKVREDPAMHRQGHENDVVYIEIPERTRAEQDATAREMFIRAIPPDQQDWITKSATIVSHAISQTTNLLLTTITAASSFYVSHSSPSQHHPAIANASQNPPPLPPRTLVFLTSEKTRQGLSSVHTVSGQAVKISAKTVSIIDNMIRRAMGNRPKYGRRFDPDSPAAMLAPPPLPSRTQSGPGGAVSPPYPGPPQGNASPSPDNKPTLPPRSASGPPEAGCSTASLAPTLRKRDRFLLSLDLIFSTIDHETRRVLDESTRTVGKVVGHKYGPDAAQASLLLAGTAKNVGLIYVDMRGIGRRALLRCAGKEYAKATLSRGAGAKLMGSQDV